MRDERESQRSDDARHHERRERIAVEAMHGLLSCITQMASKHRSFKAIASLSVGFADALIAQLEDEEVTRER